MSDTPETDALMDVWRVGKLLSVSVMLEHARKLERERDEARMASQSIVKKMMDQAAVFKREDLRDNSRWSIFNEGRAQALEKFASDLEDVMCL